MIGCLSLVRFNVTSAIYDIFVYVNDLDVDIRGVISTFADVLKIGEVCRVVLGYSVIMMC